MSFKPGYGTESLHLRQSSTDLIAILGKPTQKREYGSLREHWLYSDSGIECVVSRNSGRVLSIFYTDGSSAIVQDAHLTDIFGSSQLRVQNLYGVPDLEGGGFEIPGDGYVGKWFSYNTGIGFHFNAHGRVKMISVFSPKQKVKTKAAASHAKSHSMQVAALQR